MTLREKLILEGIIKPTQKHFDWWERPPMLDHCVNQLRQKLIDCGILKPRHFH